MAKTHTKINQLTGETLKGFAYANNTDKELVDDVLATRDPATKETEIAREYDVIKDVQNVTYTGTGIDNINIINLVGNSTYTVTVDSPLQTIRSLNQNAWIDNDCFFGNYSPSDSIFSVNVDPSIGHISTPEPVISGTFTSGEYITGNLGSTGNFISYNGTDFVYASISPFIVGEVITGTSSGASITISGTQTSTGKETFTWSENSRDLQTILSSGVLICETTPQTIGLVNTCEVTFGFTSGHDTNGEYRFFHGTGNILFQANSFTGTISDGEVVTGLTSGATAKAWIRNYGQDFVYLIPVSGAFVPGETISGASGSFQTTTIAYITDTLSITDGVTTDVNVPIILQISGNSEQISFDGGNLQFNFANDFPAQQPWRVVGDNWVIFNSQTVTTITTGYESNQITFPGVPFPIDGSAMVATDGTDKIAVGALDMKQFGQSYLTSGIVALYGDGSQTTFTTQKGFANMNLYDSATNKSMNVNYSGDNFELSGNNGSGSYGLTIDPNSFRYNTNGNNFTLPTSPGAGAGYVVTDVNGNGVLTLEPAAGGTIPGNNYEVVLSDGTGGATTTANFQYNTATLVPTILSNEGIYYDPSTRFAFLGDNNGIYNNNYVRVNDSSNEVVINTNPNGSIHIGDTAGTTLQIVVAPPTNEFKVGRVFSNQNFIYANGNSGLVTIGDTDYIFTGSNMYLDTASGVFTNVVSSMWQVTDTVGTPLIQADTVNNKTIISAAKTSINLQAYSDDTAAGIGGLVTGELYQTDGTGAAPLNVAGIVMIKQ